VLSANIATSYTDILLDWGVLVSGHRLSIGDQCLLLLMTRVDCDLFSSFLLAFITVLGGFSVWFCWGGAVCSGVLPHRCVAPRVMCASRMFSVRKFV